MCGVIDAWNTTGTQKPGIENPLGVKHTEVIAAFSSIGEKLYEYRGIISTYVIVLRYREKLIIRLLEKTLF